MVEKTSYDTFDVINRDKSFKKDSPTPATDDEDLSDDDLKIHGHV